MTAPIEAIAAARQEFQNTVKECEQFAIICRSSRLQAEQSAKLRATRLRVTAAKEVTIRDLNEDGANELLAMEFMLDAMADEMDMYIALKMNDPSTAWTNLVKAQTAATQAVKSHAIAAHLEHAYIPRLHVIERLMFPRQVFMSVGMIVERAECSVCRTVYGDCDHIKGHPYMGQMCTCIIAKAKAVEISFVEDPANKHCRILSFTDKDGVAIDPLSLESSGDMGANQSHHAPVTDESLDV